MIDYQSFFKISYGLYLVTACFEGKKCGYIANTVFQVTSSPAQFAISCNKENFSTEIIRKSNAFAFSVLSTGTSTSLIGDFGYRTGFETDKFRSVNFHIGRSGSPIITDSSIATFDCNIVQSMDCGTHILFIGELLDAALIDPSGDPLTYSYYREVMKGFSPKNAPTYIDKEMIAEEIRQQSGNEIWQCRLCHYTYESEKGDPISGIDAGVSFIDLPDDWCCPICGASKDQFDPDH